MNNNIIFGPRNWPIPQPIVNSYPGDPYNNEFASKIDAYCTDYLKHFTPQLPKTRYQSMEVNAQSKKFTINFQNGYVLIQDGQTMNRWIGFEVIKPGGILLSDKVIGYLGLCVRSESTDQFPRVDFIPHQIAKIVGDNRSNKPLRFASIKDVYHWVLNATAKTTAKNYSEQDQIINYQDNNQSEQDRQIDTPGEVFMDLWLSTERTDIFEEVKAKLEYLLTQDVGIVTTILDQYDLLKGNLMFRYGDDTNIYIDLRAPTGAMIKWYPNASAAMWKCSYCRDKDFTFDQLSS